MRVTGPITMSVTMLSITLAVFLVTRDICHIVICCDIFTCERNHIVVEHEKLVLFYSFQSLKKCIEISCKNHTFTFFIKLVLKIDFPLPHIAIRWHVNGICDNIVSSIM